MMSSVLLLENDIKNCLYLVEIKWPNGLILVAGLKVTFKLLVSKIDVFNN